MCGATRSVGALTRLDFGEALRRYPALPLLAIVAFLQLSPVRLPAKVSNRILVAVASVVLAVWVARMVVGDVPTPTTLALPW